MVEEYWCVLHLLPLVVHSLTLSQILVSRVLSGVFGGPLCLAVSLHLNLFPILDFHGLIFEGNIIHLNWLHGAILNLLLISLGTDLVGIGIGFVLVALDS